MTDTADQAPDFNALIRDTDRSSTKQLAARERLFGPDPPEPDAPTKPPGSADGGAGDASDAVYEYVQTAEAVEYMRVYDLNNLD